jgi:phage terminase large subunit-like protein
MHGPNSQSTSHSQKAHQYCVNILNGTIPACRWVRLACKRHLDDLEASAQEAYPYRYDEAKANRVCKFIELLPHVSGKWAAAKELIKLEPWQCFIVCSIFGWLKKATGKRRFTTAYVCIPRKNAKSTLAASIAIFCLVFDGEYGAQCFSGSSSEYGAHKVFDPAMEMVRRTPVLQSKFGVQLAAKTISVPTTNSKFECLIGKPGDGGSPSCAIIDEFHEHDSPLLFDTMITGAASREQPLAFVIMTAGSSLAGPCHQHQGDMEKTLDGVLDNPNWFSVIYTIDADVADAIEYICMGRN